MAAFSPQGSRAGLITALVVFVIGFVTATIYAIYYDAQWEKAKTDAAQEHATRVQYVGDADLTNAEIQKYVTSAKKPQAAINVAISERELLAKDIVGTPKTAAATADTAAAAALKYATDQLAAAKVQGVTVSADLADTIRTLTTSIITLDAERIKAEGDAKASADAAAATTAASNDLLKAKDDQIAKVTADKDAAAAAADSYRKDKDGDIAKLGSETDQKLKDTQSAAEKLQTEITKRDAAVKQLTTLNTKLETRLHATHVNVNEPVVQQADGIILRTPTQNTVFINIGQQQNVSLGLTFEVYDKEKGIPALGDGLRDGDLPVGKASIEVIHVLPTSSECRVVKVGLGETITEGDLIMNLVFDPHTHYKFMVYGNFDMSNEGTPTPGDTDVIKRLITQWGGRLVTRVDPSTDFVVLGAEPVVPILSADDQNDPPKVQQRDAMQASLDAYQEVEKQAVELGIPIMNQNRFLYFVGYYDQAGR
jgi:hypothetical protein